ncbi:hypothetical protein JCM16303_005307 [Sporobolomyces ruberrimus]
MSFFFKFLTGAVIGGTATVYYRDQIQSTSSKLSSDLNNLSHSLVQGREIEHSPVKTSNDGVAMIPKRLPLTEQVKARWNEKLSNGFESVRTTDWERVTVQTWDNLKGLVGQVQERFVEPAKDKLEDVGSASIGREGGRVRINERMVDRIDGKL